MSTATTGAALMQEQYRCSACESDDHDREDHFSARRAVTRAIAHTNAGNATEARFWGRLAAELQRKGAHQ